MYTAHSYTVIQLYCIVILYSVSIIITNLLFNYKCYVRHIELYTVIQCKTIQLYSYTIYNYTLYTGYFINILRLYSIYYTVYYIAGIIASKCLWCITV